MNTATALEPNWQRIVDRLMATFGEPQPPSVERMRKFAAELSPDDCNEYLLDIVRIHMRESWERGTSRPLLDDYVAALSAHSPEFESLDSISVDLIEAEFVARHSTRTAADHPSLEEFQARFPNRPEVRDQLLECCFGSGRFVRCRKIDEGGRGRVWLCYDQSLRRYVAIKETRPDRAAGGGAYAEMAEEAQLGASLEHPSILGVHEFHAPDDGRPFFVMRLVEGETLRSRIHDYHKSTLRAPERRRQFAELVRACAATCDAIAYAHECGVLHRDLKPANVILGPFGETVVLDWGLGKETARPESDAASPVDNYSGQWEMPLTQTWGNTVADGAGGKHPIVGTPAYMAPEQADGRATRASDLFGLGAILYELLTDKPPYRQDGEETMSAFYKRVGEARITPPELLNPKCPKPLSAICLKAMSKDPNDRYATANEIAVDLQRWMSDEPVSCRKERLWSQGLRFVRRHSQGVAVVVATLVVLFVLAIGASAYSEIRRKAEVDGERLRAETAEKRKKDIERDLLLKSLLTNRLRPRVAGWPEKEGTALKEAVATDATSVVRDYAGVLFPGTNAIAERRWKASLAVDATFDAKSQRLLVCEKTARSGRPVYRNRIWDPATQSDRLFPAPGPGPVAFLAGQPIQLLTLKSGSLVVFSVEEGRELRRLNIPKDVSGRFKGTLQIGNPTLSSKGDRVAAVVFGKDPKEIAFTLVWNSKTGKLLKPFPIAATHVAFHPRRDLIAIVDLRQNASIWSLTTGRRLVTLSNEHRNLRVNALAFGNDVPTMTIPKAPGTPADTIERLAGLLAVARKGGVLTVWDLKLRTIRCRCRGSLHEVFAVAFNGDGTTLASCGRRDARLWDTRTGGLQLIIPQSDYNLSLAFSADGKHLAVGTSKITNASDHGLINWRIENGRGIRSYYGLAGAGGRACFSPDGTMIAALSQQWVVGIWETSTSRLIARFQVRPGFSIDNSAIAISPDNRWFAFCALKEATLWDIKNHRLVKTVPLPPGLCDQLAFTPKGKHLYLFRVETKSKKNGPFSNVPPGQDPRVLRLRDLLGKTDGAQLLSEYRELNHHVWSTSCASDGSSFLAHGLTQKTQAKASIVICVDPKSPERVRWQQEKTLWENIFPIVNADNRTMSYMEKRRDERIALRLMDVKTEEPVPISVKSLGRIIGPKNKMRIEADGFALNGKARCISLYRMNDDHPFLRLSLGRPNSRYSVCFSPVGRRIAWMAHDGVVHVFDLEQSNAWLKTLGLAI